MKLVFIGAINQGILFKKGKTLKTVSSHKNILAQVNIAEEVPAEFGVYDLNNFLSVISLRQDPTFEFEDKNVIIVGSKGRSKTKYRFCEPTMIVTPPEKELVMPDPEISLTLSSEDFNDIMKTAAVLSSPHIAVESDGTRVNLSTIDTANDSAHTNTLDISEGDGKVYKMIFKTENLSKLLPGNYTVNISSKGISHFKNKDIDLQYWVTTEQGSKFDS